MTKEQIAALAQHANKKCSACYGTGIEHYNAVGFPCTCAVIRLVEETAKKSGA